MRILEGIAGIVPIKYSIVSPEFLMIGMEYFTNGSLEQYVNGETMEESNIKSFAHQILTAMFGYSEKGIVHRDIKPENILLDSHGKIKISDFGLARETNGKSSLSTRIDSLGTERYLSPEIKNGKSQSIKSDVWAFGVVILELTYGRNAFEIDKICSSNPKKIISRFKKRGGYSIDLALFISRCFERESVRRASVEDLLKDKWFSDVQKNPSIELKSSPYIKSSNNNYKIYITIVIL